MRFGFVSLQGTLLPFFRKHLAKFVAFSSPRLRCFLVCPALHSISAWFSNISFVNISPSPISSLLMITPMTISSPFLTPEPVPLPVTPSRILLTVTFFTPLVPFQVSPTVVSADWGWALALSSGTFSVGLRGFFYRAFSSLLVLTPTFVLFLGIWSQFMLWCLTVVSSVRPYVLIEVESLMNINSRVSHNTHFFELSYGLLTSHANGFHGATKKFSAL